MKFVAIYPVENGLDDDIREEIQSSFLSQSYPPLPLSSLSPLTTPASHRVRKSPPLSNSAFFVDHMGTKSRFGSPYPSSKSVCQFLSPISLNTLQMHRARLCNSDSLEYNWYHPQIRFIGVPRGDLEVKGDFDRISRGLAAKASENADHVFEDDAAFIYMPVHELQVENIRSRMTNLKILDPEISFHGQAQSSLR